MAKLFRSKSTKHKPRFRYYAFSPTHLLYKLRTLPVNSKYLFLLKSVNYILFGFYIVAYVLIQIVCCHILESITNTHEAFTLYLPILYIFSFVVGSIFLLPTQNSTGVAYHWIRRSSRSVYSDQEYFKQVKHKQTYRENLEAKVDAIYGIYHQYHDDKTVISTDSINNIDPVLAKDNQINQQAANAEGAEMTDPNSHGITKQNTHPDYSVASITRQASSAFMIPKNPQNGLYNRQNTSFNFNNLEFLAPDAAPETSVAKQLERKLLLEAYYIFNRKTILAFVNSHITAASCLVRHVIMIIVTIYYLSLLQRSSNKLPWSDENVPQVIKALNTCFLWTLTIDHLLCFLASSRKLSFHLKQSNIFDLLVLPPTLLFVERQWGKSVTLYFIAFRIVKLFKFEVLLSLASPHIPSLIITLSALIVDITLMILIFALSIYLLESPSKSIHTIFDYVYFTIITVTTVGFGDYAPQTSLGKYVTVICVLLSIYIFQYQIQRLLSTIRAPIISLGPNPSSYETYIVLLGDITPHHLGVIIHECVSAYEDSIGAFFAITTYSIRQFKSIISLVWREYHIKLHVTQKFPLDHELQNLCEEAVGVYLFTSPRYDIVNERRRATMLFNDQTIFLRLTKLQPMCWPTTVLNVQFFTSRFENLALDSGVYQTVILEDLKYRVIGKAVTNVPGFITLVFNWWQTPSADSTIKQYLEEIQRCVSETNKKNLTTNSDAAINNNTKFYRHHMKYHSQSHKVKPKVNRSFLLNKVKKPSVLVDFNFPDCLSANKRIVETSVDGICPSVSNQYTHQNSDLEIYKSTFLQEQNDNDSVINISPRTVKNSTSIYTDGQRDFNFEEQSETEAQKFKELNLYYYLYGLQFHVYRMVFPMCMVDFEFSFLSLILQIRYGAFLIGLITSSRTYLINPVGFIITEENRNNLFGVILTNNFDTVLMLSSLKSLSVSRNAVNDNESFLLKSLRTVDDLISSALQFGHEVMTTRQRKQSMVTHDINDAYSNDNLTKNSNSVSNSCNSANYRRQMIAQKTHDVPVNSIDSSNCFIAMQKFQMSHDSVFDKSFSKVNNQEKLPDNTPDCSSKRSIFSKSSKANLIDIITNIHQSMTAKNPTYLENNQYLEKKPTKDQLSNMVYSKNDFDSNTISQLAEQHTLEYIDNNDAPASTNTNKNESLLITEFSDIISILHNFDTSRRFILVCGWPASLSKLIHTLNQNELCIIVLLYPEDMRQYGNLFDVGVDNEIKVFWYRGSGLRASDLKAAGVLFADAVVILSMAHTYPIERLSLSPPADNQVILVRQQILALFSRVHEYFKSIKNGLENYIITPLILADIQHRESLDLLTNKRDTFLIDALRNVIKQHGDNVFKSLIHGSYGGYNGKVMHWQTELTRHEENNSDDSVCNSIFTKSDLDSSSYSLHPAYRSGSLYLHEVPYTGLFHGAAYSLFAVELTLMSHLADGSYSSLYDYVSSFELTNPELSRYKWKNQLTLRTPPKFKSQMTFQNVYNYFNRYHLCIAIGILRMIEMTHCKDDLLFRSLFEPSNEELVISCPPPDLIILPTDLIYCIEPLDKHLIGAVLI